MKGCLGPSTSEELQARVNDILSFVEFLEWLGFWFIEKLHPGHQPKDLFPLKSKDKNLNPSCLIDAMSGNRFKRINEFPKLDEEDEAHEHGYILFWVRKL